MNQLLGAMIHKIHVVSLLLMFVRTPVSHSHHFPSRESRTTFNKHAIWSMAQLLLSSHISLLPEFTYCAFSLLGLCRDIDFLLEAAILSYSPVSIDWHCSPWQEQILEYTALLPPVHSAHTPSKYYPCQKACALKVAGSWVIHLC